MPKHCFATFAVLVLSSCGGGGGSKASSESDVKFIESVPSEKALCSLTVGVSTRADVEHTLGEPTHFTESPERSILQYWYGTLQEFGMGNLKTIVVSFDATGILESPSVDGLPFPNCWRTRP